MQQPSFPRLPTHLARHTQLLESCSVLLLEITEMYLSATRARKVADRVPYHHHVTEERPRDGRLAPFQHRTPHRAFCQISSDSWTILSYFLSSSDVQALSSLLSCSLSFSYSTMTSQSSNLPLETVVHIYLLILVQ